MRSKRIPIAISMVLLLVVLGAVWIYERMAAPSQELHAQLQAMIANHNVAKMKAVSIDQSTEAFLVKLKSGITINTSDFQGGGHPQPHVTVGAFSALVGKTPLDCVMVLYSNGFSLIPQWKLVKVSLTPMGIDPAWANNNS